jgi:hypothetical protein
MLDRSQAGTYTSVSANVAGARAVARRGTDEDGTPYAYVDVSAHIATPAGEQASWSATLYAPAAADLLALLVPVVETLRGLAADELLGERTEVAG